ncbi:hypothetical protein EK21DRAFT_58428 [Setomelanomma holmii]|uniref:MARVEL domain-containing protein n=1 Tax=Setomelanomma holmii TaxID=210430 RepID=A0A9P4HGB4_9PLEO|nr:hypothetical protein EK21DRAFT_58428 [Setomelanomma holmii]
MAVNWILPVRGVQAVLAITVLGLMAYVSSWWLSHWRESSPSEVNFLIFAPSWTVLALVPLIAMPWRFSHLLSSSLAKWGLLTLEGLTMLFWFGGFVALAVFLSDRICFGTVCDVARASTAISAFNWVAWAITFVVSVVKMFKGGDMGFGRRKGGVDVGAGKVDMHQGV